MNMNGRLVDMGASKWLHKGDLEVALSSVKSALENLEATRRKLAEIIGHAPQKDVERLNKYLLSANRSFTELRMTKLEILEQLDDMETAAA
jgi:adenine deaminase